MVVQLPAAHSLALRLLVLLNIVENRGEEHRGVETLRQLGVQVGGEDARGGKHRLRRPVLRLCDPEDLEGERRRERGLPPSWREKE